MGGHGASSPVAAIPPIRLVQPVPAVTPESLAQELGQEGEEERRRRDIEREINNPSETKPLSDEAFSLVAAEVDKINGKHVNMTDMKKFPAASVVAIKKSLEFVKDLFGIDTSEREIINSAKNYHGASPSTLAGMEWPTGNLLFANPMKNIEFLKKRMKMSEDSGFHPKNSSSDAIMATVVHEMGHAVHNWIAKKEASYDIFASMERPKILKSIVDNAYKTVKKKGVTKDQARQAISGYANISEKYKDHETIAEAISDYYLNRDNANPFSKAIVKEIQKRVKA